MIKSTAIWLRRTLKLVLLTGLLLVATYASLGRYYIDYVEKYQGLLVGYFVDYTGLPMQVGDLSARWSQLSFILSLKNIELLSGDEVVLSIPRADFKVNPLQSLLDKKVLIDSVSVHGLNTQLTEVELGRWRLAGFEYQTSTEGDLDLEQLLDFFLAIDRFEFFKSAVTLLYRNEDSSSLYFDEMTVRHQDGFRRIHISADLQEDIEHTSQPSHSPIDLIVESQGDPRDLNFSAKAYAKLEGVDLVEQLPVLHSFGFTPEEVKMDGRIWMEWLPGRVISIQGNVSTPLLDLAGFSDTTIPAIEALDIDFRLEKSLDQEWLLWMPQVRGSWQQQSIHLKNFFVQLVDHSLTVQLPQLDAASVSEKLLNLKVLPEKAQKALKDLSPQGEVSNIRVRLPFAEDVSRQYELTGGFDIEAELSAMTLDSWRGTPEVDNVNGYVHVDKSGGHVIAASEQFSIGFPGVYHDVMNFDVMRAKVSWTIEPGRVKVDSGVIDLRADHGPAVAQLALDLPTQGQEPPTMFLAVGLKNTPANFRAKFIPALLSENLRGWLDRSIQAGDIEEAGFIYNGSLRKGDDHARTVQLFLDVNRGQLEYDSAWPALTEIDASVVVDDSDVDVQGSTLRTNNLAAEDVRVTVKSLDDGLLLGVNGKLDGSAEDALSFVNRSYLREIVGDVFADWQLTGDINGQLDLTVPLLSEQKKPVVEFTSFISAGHLFIPSYRVGIEDFYGPLNYSSANGMSSEGIEGLSFGGKTKVSIEQALNDAVAINIDGVAATEALAQWTQFPGFAFVDGLVNYQSSLVVGSDNDRFSLTSNLKGVAIDLPEPLGKSKAEESLLAIDLALAEEQSVLSLQLDNSIRSRVRLDDQVVTAGDLIFSPEIETAMPENKFVISGQLQGVGIDEIQTVVQRYLKQSDVLSAVNPAEVTAADVAVPELAFRVEALTLFNTELYGTALERVVTEVNKRDDGWLLGFSSQKGQGSVLFPHLQSEPLRIELEQLHLLSKDAQLASPADMLSDEQNANSTPTSLFDSIDLTDVDDFNIAIKQLTLDDELLGHLAFDVRATDQQMLVNNLRGEIKSLMLGDDQGGLQLAWKKDSESAESAIKGRIHFLDVGDVLERWDYERAIESRRGAIELDLKWPGAPDQWQLALSKGSIKLDVEDGIFLKTAKGASGALKLVSVANLNNILRRLRLDFTDLYKAGVSFDAINGHFDIADGRMSIVDHLNIDSPSSRFRVIGSTNLHTEQLDMDLIATLPIGKNLPWVAALMGGLPTAAIVYGVSKIFENQVDQLSSAVYSLEGQWDDPQLNLKRVFDVKGAHRKKEARPETSGDEVLDESASPEKKANITDSEKANESDSSNDQ